jgi:hypothetical protein
MTEEELEIIGINGNNLVNATMESLETNDSKLERQTLPHIKDNSKLRSPRNELGGIEEK